MLLLLDGLEEQRPLSSLESAFRGLVKSHIAKLLEEKRIYWKQRNTVRWVKLGDENTSFFQAMASISHRRNKIASLSILGNILVTNHAHKADILWEAFKSRLGVSDFCSICYDLSSLLRRQHLDHLANEFSAEEVKTVISKLPLNHAPGPDGFNGKFIKKMLAIIKPDFLKLFNDFFNNTIDLTSINSSHIALIPKKNNPKTVDVYRPISLLNYSIKSITKLLSSRLQNVILNLVHANQYGFIRGRTIQDCLA